MNNKSLKTELSLPLIAAPMFLISNPDMALATCREGVVGSFPALNQRTSAGLETWLQQMNTTLDQWRKAEPDQKIAPYAVNLIVHPTNARLQADLDLLVKYKVPVVITSLGAVPDVVKKVHSYGGIVLHDVTNVKHGKKAAQAGVDGLIAVAAGAGGHGGTQNPISLVGEIRQFFDGLLLLAGSLSHGKDILAAEVMGADLAYMGTRFITTAESGADPDYKKMVCDAAAADIVYTSAISGIPANFLRKSLENAGLDVKKLEQKGARASKLKSFNDEARAWKNIWSAGQGAGNIADVPTVAELINRLKGEYRHAQLNVINKSKPNGPTPS